MQSTTNVDIIFVDEARDPSSMLQTLVRNSDQSLVAISLHQSPQVPELSRAVAVINRSKSIRFVITSRRDDTLVVTKGVLEAIARSPLQCSGREALRELVKRATSLRKFGILKISGTDPSDSNQPNDSVAT